MVRVIVSRGKKARSGAGGPGGAGGDRPQVLRPGILMPLIGYAGAFGMGAAAVVMAVFAHAGGSHVGMPPRGDWSAVGDRLLAGEVSVAFAWALYKLGSMRIVLDSSVLRVVSWGLAWTVGRDEVSDVVLSASDLSICLAGGGRIRPMMFWSSGPGVIYFRLGLFADSMSRETIRDRILEWRQSPASLVVVGAGAGAGGRRWRVRADLWLLIGMAGVIAAEAVAATAWW